MYITILEEEEAIKLNGRDYEKTWRGKKVWKLNKYNTNVWNFHKKVKKKFKNWKEFNVTENLIVNAHIL